MAYSGGAYTKKSVQVFTIVKILRSKPIIVAATSLLPQLPGGRILDIPCQCYAHGRGISLWGKVCRIPFIFPENLVTRYTENPTFKVLQKNEGNQFRIPSQKKLLEKCGKYFCTPQIFQEYLLIAVFGTKPESGSCKNKCSRSFLESAYNLSTIGDISICLGVIT